MTHKLIALAGVLLATSPWILPPTGGSDADGTVQTDLDLAGNHITDSTGMAQLCGAQTTSHSLGTGDGGCGGSFEVDGTMYLDGTTLVGSGSQIRSATGYGALQPVNTSQTQSTLAILAGSTSNHVLIIPYADFQTNYSHSVPTDPTIFQHSSDETDITQFYSLDWRRLALGGNGGGLGCINETFAYDDMTDGGAAVGTFDMTETIPDGAVVQQAILHTLTGFTGDVSAAITIGDGTDVDRYNTGTPSVFTTNASGVDLGVPSGTAWHDDAKTVTITITTNADYTSVSAGQATVAICYWTP